MGANVTASPRTEFVNPIALRIPNRCDGRAAFSNKAVCGRYVIVQAAASLLTATACGVAPLDSASSITAASWLFTACVAWILYSWARLAGSIFSPYWLFVVVSVLFNGGHAVLQVLGLNERGVLGSAFSETTTAATVYFTTLSLMLMHLGALLRLALRPANTAESSARANDRFASQLGLLMILIAIVPMYLQVRDNLSTVINSGYLALYQREVKTNVGSWHALLSQFMLPGAFLIAAASRERSTLRNLSLVIVLLYFVIHMFTGYRGTSVAAAAAFGWVWHTRIRRLPIPACVAAGALISFVVFPMISVFRASTGEDRLSWSSFTRTLETIENPAVSALSEMGTSMNTTAHTMDLVPAIRDFDAGASYLFAALTVVPNIFGTPLHPSTERGTPSEWLIRTVSYRVAMAGGGMGYSYIAESYLNFGWMGPPLVMVILGFALAALECAAVSRNASSGIVCLMGVVVYFCVIYARAESASIVRGIVWCGVIPFLVLRLVYSSRRQAPRGVLPRHVQLPSPLSQGRGAHQGKSGPIIPDCPAH